MTSPQRKHVTIASHSAILLLLLPLFGPTSGLQQRPSSTTVFLRRLVSVKRQSLCLWSVSLDDTLDQTSDLLTDKGDRAYDWDEQFEELQSFKSKYGHCNFPQNPPEQLRKKYPMLKRFCHDQRIDSMNFRSNRSKYKKSMNSLAVFDLTVRLRVLGEMDFEFTERSAKWYDLYHELIQYLDDNGHMRVTKAENEMLAQWVYVQRTRRRKGTTIKGYTRIPERQIKLLDDIGFEWTPTLCDEEWNVKYNELVAFRNQHGHIRVDHRGQLYTWMVHQRRRHAKKKGFRPLTDEEIRLLDEIEFPWKPERYDSKWYEVYDEMQRFQQKHGHCQPARSTHEKLNRWAFYQQMKYRKGSLSTEHIKLLNKIGFPLEVKSQEWPKMCNELNERFNTRGHLRLNPDDDSELNDWIDHQRKRYHGIEKPTLSDDQIDRLEDLHFSWSLDWRERTWHEKYTEVVEFFKEHGHVRVTKEENPSLYNWIEIQAKRYEELEGQKPLSEEELEMLEQIDFPFLADGQTRMVWNARYAEVARYREENDGRFPTSHKDDPDLNCWIRQQRHRYRSAYGYAPLSDEQKSLLESIDFPMYPNGKQKRWWYEKYDDLVDFRKQHGHLFVDKSEDPSLCGWVDAQRTRFKRKSANMKPLSKLQLYLLERIGFTWTSPRNDMKWQKNYDEVAEFVEVRGHFPKMSENPKLATWLARQRLRYKGKYDKLSEYQIQQLEKFGFSTE